MCLNVGGWGFKGIDQVKSPYNYYFDIRKEHSFLDKYKLPQKNLFLCILTHWKLLLAVYENLSLVFLIRPVDVMALLGDKTALLSIISKIT